MTFIFRYDILIVTKDIFRGGIFTHNAIIVDDEVFEAKCISKIIKWKEYNMNLAGVFNNPLDALSYIKKNKTDIILSDIKMPFIDGINLCQKAKEINPDTIFIIITAYADFTYAQQAIKQNVFDYIVKPVTGAKITELFQKLQNHFENVNKKRDIEDDIDISFLIQQQMISDYILGKTDIKVLNEKLGNCLKTPVSSARVALTKIEFGKFSEYLKCAWKHGIDRFYSFVLSQLNSCTVISFPLEMDFDSITIISFSNGSNEKEFIEDIKQLFINLKKLCSETLNISPAYSKTDIYQSIESLKKSSIKPLHRVTYAQNSMSEKIDAAKKYIQKNYMNEISIYDISNLVGLSPYYFSEHFKKSEGISFSAYIAKIKIEEAKKLLAVSNMTVNEICSAINFGTTKYFFKIFKDYTGMTPKEYRTERKGTEENPT